MLPSLPRKAEEERNQRNRKNKTLFKKIDTYLLFLASFIDPRITANYFQV